MALYTGKETLDTDDIKFATDLKKSHNNEFVQRPEVSKLEKWARLKNQIEIPNVPKARIPLPEQRFCLISPNFIVCPVDDAAQQSEPVRQAGIKKRSFTQSRAGKKITIKCIQRGT